MNIANISASRSQTFHNPPPRLGGEKTSALDQQAKVTNESDSAVPSPVSVDNQKDKRAANNELSLREQGDRNRITNPPGVSTSGAVSKKARVGDGVSTSVPATSKQSDWADEAAAKVGIKMDHITKGEINHDGKAVGYHHRPLGQDLGGARITQVTQLLNERSHGVYKAKVEILDHASSKVVEKEAESTFFPDHYGVAQVEAAIRHAYADSSRGFKYGGDSGTDQSWHGKSGDGFIIGGYVDNAKSPTEITSAFPHYKK